jgi:hypothetical protein
VTREQICSFQRQFLLQARAIAAEAAASGSEHVFAKPDAPPGHSHGPGGGGEGTAGAGSAGNGGGAARGGFGIGPILSILELSRSPTNSSRGSRYDCMFRFVPHRCSMFPQFLT